MSYSPNSDFWVNLARGFYPEYTENHKFGTNAAVGATLVPLTGSGVYQTPTAATALEIISTSAADTAAGAGARTVVVVGLDANWAEVSQTITMNGLVAVAIPTSLLRVYRMYVATSGAYATTGAGSHVGTITVRVAGGGATWSQIVLSSAYALGQSTIGCYTVPTGKTALIFPHYLSVDAGKTGSFIFFKRENADTVAAPYSPMRIIFSLVGVAGFASLLDNATPLGPFVGPCDLITMGTVTPGTGAISIDFEIIQYTT